MKNDNKEVAENIYLKRKAFLSFR